MSSMGGDSMLKGTRRVMGAVLAFVFAVLVWSGPVLGKTRSVILLIGDGMGFEQVRAASIKLGGAAGKLAMQSLPVQGSLSTHSADSAVTDSAAAGTALATGRKTNNGVIAISPGGTPLKTILEACRDAGKATGLVATSTITHATPASFGSHVESRGSEYEIAGQMVDARINVLLGGGKGNFLAAKAEGWVGLNVSDQDGKKIMAITDTVNWFDYRRLEHSFLAPPGAAKASVWLWRGPGEAGIFLDDVVLQPVDEKGNPAGDNLVTDSGFENRKLEGWNDWGGLKVVEDGGSMALKVATSGGGERSLAIETGRSYGINYRARMEDPGAGGGKLTPWEKAEKNGYRVIEKKEDLARVRGKHVLGLFKAGALEGKPDEPTLAEMTGKAVGLLSDDRQGFFLMVEGSQIDWAGHGNDSEYFFREMASFDAAIKVALEYAKREDDVLVIVTADHETGGLEVGGNDAASLKLIWTSKDHTATRVPVFAFGPGSERFSGEMDNTEVATRMAEVLGVNLTGR